LITHDATANSVKEIRRSPQPGATEPDAMIRADNFDDDGTADGSGEEVEACHRTSQPPHGLRFGLDLCPRPEHPDQPRTFIGSTLDDVAYGVCFVADAYFFCWGSQIAGGGPAAVCPPILRAKAWALQSHLSPVLWRHYKLPQPLGITYWRGRSCRHLEPFNGAACNKLLRQKILFFVSFYLPPPSYPI